MINKNIPLFNIDELPEYMVKKILNDLLDEIILDNPDKQNDVCFQQNLYKVLKNSLSKNYMFLADSTPVNTKVLNPKFIALLSTLEYIKNNFNIVFEYNSDANKIEYVSSCLENNDRFNGKIKDDFIKTLKAEFGEVNHNTYIQNINKIIGNDIAADIVKWISDFAYNTIEYDEENSIFLKILEDNINQILEDCKN